MNVIEEVELYRAFFKKKGWSFFENGDFNLNIIAIRSDDKFDNQFTDELIVIYKYLAVWQIFKCFQFNLIFIFL